MIRDTPKLDIVRKLVIVSDIRSSTSILEDLKATDNLDRWQDLLINVKDELIHNGSELGITMYKFIGDGWILLAPPNIGKSDLLAFLRNFSMYFDMMLDSHILDLLSRKPESLGLTFGVDTGDLARLEMNGQSEYIGRAINVAARLQSEAKKYSNKYSAIFSKNSYGLAAGWSAESVLNNIKVSLKNIGGGAEIECLFYEAL